MFYKWSNLGIFGILIVVVSQTILISHGAKLNANGGYEIVIGIKEDESRPSVGVGTYVDTIKSSFQLLSSGMWKATDEKFHIQSVQVVIPPTWDYEGATTALNSYQSSDVRISKANKYPQADNPNFCGLPGSHIELPNTYFNTVNKGPYGDTWKALLNVWARYRWGVWEEHGYPGDKKFPYFYKPNNNQGTPWVATGCSNVPLNGTFQTANGTACDATGDVEMDVSCRFMPSRTENKNAKSSLMHFHWLESVERFCDKASHSKVVPNKQNLFCDYKSAMEIIETSLDSKTVNVSQGFVPAIKFEVRKASTLPPLYVLLDRESFDAADGGIINIAIPEIGKLFGNNLLPMDTTVALGEFPTSETNPNVKEIIPFTLLQGQEDRFVEAIADRQSSTATNGDFGHAIQQAIDAIKKTGSIKGGRILILKTRGASNSSSFSYEKEIELNLLQHDIAVYAIEVSGPNHERQNLVNLATVTNGLSEAINTPSGAQRGAAALVKAVADSYTATPFAPLATNTPRITFRGEIIPGLQYSIPVLQNTETLVFHYITPENTNSSLIKGGVDTSSLTFLVPFQGASEYSGTANNLTRFTYTGTLDATKFNLHEVTFNVSSPSNVRGYLLVTASGSKVDPDITVEITTSAINDEVDLAQVTNRNAPFAIFAKARQGAKAVAGASLVATLELAGSGTMENVQLYDNGAGSEDVAANDGIYSAIVVPTSDGAYSIRVTVSKAASTRSLTQQLTSSASSRLIPVDQNFIPAGESVEIPEALYKNVNYDGYVTVKNRGSYKNVISKVRDLTVSSGAGLSDVTFSHTVPKVLGQNGSPNYYAYFVSATRDLLSNFDPIAFPPPPGIENIRNHTDVASKPGQTSTVHINVARSGLFYYAVASMYGTEKSELSNIVDISTVEGPSTTTSPTGGTTEEGNNSSTTDSGEAEENKPWLKKTGGIITIVVIVLVVFIGAGAGYWYLKKRRAGKSGTTFSKTPAAADP